MTIGSITGAGSHTNPGSIGIGASSDPVSRQFQQQIADAQKRLQEVSSDGELSVEEKMKKRQEIQQEISNLNQQLRQHQAEQRKEQQAAAASRQEGAGQKAARKPGHSGNGLSQEHMQAMISADASVKQARVQGATAKQMEGRAGVLKTEIKQDAGRGDTKKKQEELAELQEKIQDTQASQMSTLADANQAVQEAAAAKSESGTDSQKQSKTDEEKQAAANGRAKKAANADGDVKASAASRAADNSSQKTDETHEDAVKAAPDRTAVTQLVVGAAVDIRL